MPDPQRFYVVRHGETDANLVSRYSGWSDDRLNARGLEQGFALARELGGEGIEAIYTSPVRRAVETAGILGEELSATVRTVHDLREIEIGPWRGLTEDEVARTSPAEYARWREAPETIQLRGRETLEALSARALGALDHIARARVGREETPAVVVTHLALIRVLWLTAGGRPLAEYHSVAGPHCRPFPIRWLSTGRIDRAGEAPSGELRR